MENNSYPVSIEIFAAYMDGNLSVDEMHNIESLINNNNSLCRLKFIYDEIGTNQDSVIDQEYLEQLDSCDFKIPEIKTSGQSMISDDLYLLDSDDIKEDENQDPDRDGIVDSEIDDDNFCDKDEEDTNQEDSENESDEDYDENTDEEIDNDF